jgi:hypothetical protein
LGNIRDTGEDRRIGLEAFGKTVGTQPGGVFVTILEFFENGDCLALGILVGWFNLNKKYNLLAGQKGYNGWSQGENKNDWWAEFFHTGSLWLFSLSLIFADKAEQGVNEENCC